MIIKVEAVMDNEMNHGYYVEMLDNNLDTFSLLMNLDSVLWNQTEQPLSVSDFLKNGNVERGNQIIIILI